MKKIIRLSFFTIILITCMLILCSCRSDPKSEQEVLDYAQRKYGSCTLVESDTSDKDKTVITVRDDSYGFTYNVTSSVNDINIDGSVFGKVEDTYDSYIPSFRDFIAEDAKNDFEYIRSNFKIKTELNDTTLRSLMYIYIDDSDIKNAREITRRAASIFSHYDKKNVFSLYDVTSFDNNEQLLGKCSVTKGEWMDYEAIMDDRIIQWAKSRKSSCTYLRKEKHKFSETGLSPGDVMKFYYETDINCPQDPDDEITLYYFKSDGKEFYVADFMYTVTDSYYSNYDEVFG